jgi:glycosyltransferase involved in cell wall biosynthesis
MMPEREENETQPLVPADVALCIGPGVYGRLRLPLRYLCVGMIDYNVSVRLITSSAELASLTLGPIQLLTHELPPWPMRCFPGARRRREEDLIGRLSERPPAIVHAVGCQSFDVAERISETFEAALVLQFSSFRDVDAATASQVERAECFVVGSQSIYDRLDELVSPASHTIHLIRPGTRAEAQPCCFSRPGQIPSIVCNDSFEPGCGIEILLHAVRILRSRNHELLTFLTGTGPMEAELRRKAQSLNADSAVIFARPTGDTERIMTGADIYVQPSADPALTSNPIYAMANGMAVVAVDGGANDCFVNEVTALVCPAASSEELAQAIEKLLADREFAVSLASRAIHHIKTYHAISSMVEQTVDCYQDLLVRRRTFTLNSRKPVPASGRTAPPPDSGP